ncbi:MAG: DUF6220 domain-containing protein [Thermomicrobia bacterium]|nr:DUF6220 domain-containing protein [Thermomicrobia bacterium]MCA1723421.1 DUF6220 domain-containing protein [Thermomicrobia bacterium]
MRKAITTMHAGLAWIILAAVGAQFFLVGLGLFGATNLGAHRLVGYLIIPASLLLLLLAGRVDGGRIGQSAALFGLTVVQSFLPKAPSLVAALHPVNAVVILFVALNLARNGVRDRTRTRAAATSAGVRSVMSGGR